MKSTAEQYFDFHKLPSIIAGSDYCNCRPDKSMSMLCIQLTKYVYVHTNLYILLKLHNELGDLEGNDSESKTSR